MFHPILMGLLIAMIVAVDVWAFDQDQKRWGWFKAWPKPAKIVAFIGLTFVMTAFWSAVNWKYV